MGPSWSLSSGPPLPAVWFHHQFGPHGGRASCPRGILTLLQTALLISPLSSILCWPPFPSWKLSPTSRPLHLLFHLPGPVFPQISIRMALPSGSFPGC